MSLSIYHTHHSLTQVQCIVEEGEDTGASQEEDYCCWEITYCFGADSIYEEVVGFSPFMVSPIKNIVFIVSCV